MKFIITEEQGEHLKEWLRFDMFMRRRGEQIRDIITKDSYAYKYDIERYDEDILVERMLELVVGEFCDINKIGYDGKEYDWVHFYIKDYYTDYIKKVLGFLDKNTITESEKERLKVLRRVNDEDWIWIRDIVDEGTDIYNPCDYRNEEDYLNSVSLSSAQTYLFYYFDNGRSESFLKLTDYIKSLIIRRMGDDIIEYYTNKIEDDECN